MSNALKEYYSKKSTEELEEIIRLDVDSGDGDGLDFEALNAILEVLQDRSYAEEFIKNGPTWEDFEKYYLPGLKERKSISDDINESVSADTHNGTLTKLSPSVPVPAAKRKRFLPARTLKVAGIAVAITIALFCTLFVGTYAAGYNVWGAVVQWTNETFRFDSGDGAKLIIPTADEYSGEYQSLEEAFEDHGISEQLAPTWLPDGYFFEVS